MYTLSTKVNWNEKAAKLRQQFANPQVYVWRETVRRESRQGAGWRHCGLVMLFIVSCALLGVGRAAGQTTETSPEPLISNTIGFGAQVGFHKVSDADAGSAYLSILTRIRISSIIGLEGAVGYQTEQQFAFPSPTGTDLTAKVHSIPTMVSLILYLPIAPNFSPYVVGGVGAHYVILDYSQYLNDNFLSDRKKMRFGYQLGFGLELPINKHLALHGDYRYLYVDKAFEQEVQFDFSGTTFRANLISAGFVAYF